MRDCFKPYYFEDNQIKDCELFNPDFILKGTTLYEVVRIIEGRALFLDDHINRLFLSAKLAGFVLWKTYHEIITAVYEVVKQNNCKSGNIKFLFNYKKDEKRFIVYFIEHHYPSKMQYADGVSVVTAKAIRPNPNIKVYNFDLRKETDELIKKHEAYEVILVDSNGFITEGSKSNVFCLQNDDILTPPEHLVLPGITRKYIVKVCNELGLNVIERNISLSELNEMDAIFLTGTSPKVLPVSVINDKKYSFENIHLKHIMMRYDDLIEEEIRKQSSENS